MSNPIRRLLRRNISAGQIAGYAVANLVGLLIVLTAIQFYRDVTSVSQAEDSFVSDDYLIISKRVEGVQGLVGHSGAATTFTRDERSEISSQPWASGVGEFTSADFNVSAQVNVAGANLSTALFLESIPDEFFDISPRGWDYRPGSGDPVPVIISKDYLTLYNFGFAASRGMPQISEELIGMLPLKLSLSGNGRQQWVDARIVGFSSRLNTIAVPADFLNWANGVFGEGKEDTDPSRLIVRLRRAGDPEATAYMEAHGYEIAGDKASGGKAAYFLSVVTTVVVAIGAIISILAFFILLLSIYLLLQKNRGKIHDLMLLGYTPSQVARYYEAIVVSVNAGVLLLALAGMLMASAMWQGSIEALGAEGASCWPTVLTGVVIILVITAGNIMAIRRNVRSSFRN